MLSPENIGKLNMRKSVATQTDNEYDICSFYQNS